MTAPAAEREATLAAHLDQARRAVGDLTARISAAESEAHAAYVDGDAAAGHDATERAAGLRGQLAQAQTRLAALETAAHAVATERVRDEHEAQLAAIATAMEQAADQAASELANVRPCLTAARQALQTALAYEQRANELYHQQHALLVALGRAEHGRITSPYNRAQVLLGEEPVIRAVLQHPGF